MQSEMPNRYSVASIMLHWVMLVLLIGVYAAIELRVIYPKGSDPREALKMWHFMLGLAVLALVWLRIGARLLWAAPAPDVLTPAWQRTTAKATHLALYIFMIAMPLAGWAILSAQGNVIPFFGLELPPLIRGDLAGDGKALARQIKELHEIGGTIGYWLIGLHAAAALFHQLILKDRLLNKMLPSRP